MPFQPGHPGYKKRGSKNKSTLDKEMRRAVFDEEVSKQFIELIRKAKPEYKLDQFLGKAKDTVEHKVNFLFDEDANDQVENLVEKVE